MLYLRALVGRTQLNIPPHRLRGGILDPWKEDLLQTFQSIDCERQMFAMVAELARKLEFDYCAYGLRMPLPLARPKTALFSNYPAVWQARYQAQGYQAIDPTVQVSRVGNMAPKRGRHNGATSGAA